MKDLTHLYIQKHGVRDNVNQIILIFTAVKF